MLPDVPQPVVPDAIADLAEERARARADRDWARADELRGAIEAAGWRIEDDGTAYRVSAALAPDVEVEGRRFYGSPVAVPSVLDEPPTRRATILIDAGRAPDPGATLASLTAVEPEDVQVVVVAPMDAAGVHGPAPSPAAASGVEVVGTATPFSAAGALQAGLRRAHGALVVVLSPHLVIDGDDLGPLETALGDPTIAIVGDAGLASTDLRRFSHAPAGDVAAVGPGCYAFRRADAIALGPIDEQVNLAEGTAVWLSLALRDGGPDVPPRRALAIPLSVRRAPSPAVTAAPHDEPGRDEAHQALQARLARLARRDGYRIADRFADHRWLAVPGEVAGRAPEEGTEGHDERDDGHEGQDAGEA